MIISSFKSPNLQAPRYRPEQYNLLTREFFSSMRKQHPELKGFTDPQLRNVIKLSNILIYKNIIDKRDGVEFPEFLGYSFIGTCPKKIGENVDYRLSMEHRAMIQHRNWESDSYLAKIFYTNYESKYRFKFHDLWTFSGSRNFTREVGVEYPKDWKKYIQVDHSLKISRLFRKEKMRNRRIKQTEILLETYNEFEGF